MLGEPYSLTGGVVPLTRWRFAPLSPEGERFVYLTTR